MRAIHDGVFGAELWDQTFDSDATTTYGPAEITLIDGRLFRGDNEFYPIADGRYYIPASGTIMRFRRDSTGAVDTLVSIGGSGQESVLPRSQNR